ncbi:MAG: heme-binding protein [bacterium]
MKNILKLFLSALFLLVFIGASPIMAKYETPEYQVIKSYKNIEIRKYPSYLVAEVTTTGERDKAANEAFMILFDYISGKNIPNEKIPMTVPVTQSGEKISMTIPVQQIKENNNWKLSFVVPSKYTLENVPKPKDERIKIYKQEESRRAVIRFSGLSSESNLSKNKQKLDNFIKENGFKIKSEPIYAFYDAPFTLPFLRRNEIMYIID